MLISGRGSEHGRVVAQRLRRRCRGRRQQQGRCQGARRCTRCRDIATFAISHRDYADREAFDAALVTALNEYQPDLVVLAGFMRILTPVFVNAFAGRLINIHPSLLPSFPGLDTHERALADGVKLHGCTVHFVTPELDRGPIIAQAAVQVDDEDTPDTLAAKVLTRSIRSCLTQFGCSAKGDWPSKGYGCVPAQRVVDNPCHRARRSGRLAAAMADAVSSFEKCQSGGCGSTRFDLARGLARRRGLLATPRRKLTLALAASLVLHLLIGAAADVKPPEDKSITLAAKLMPLPPPPVPVAAASAEAKQKPKTETGGGRIGASGHRGRSRA